MSRMLSLSIATLILCVGCGAPTGRITGTVTFDGKPLPAGRITFLCFGEGRPVLSSPIADGRYLMEAVPVGGARIAVETFNTEAFRQPKPAPGVPAITLSPAFMIGPPGPYVKIPDRYRHPDDSGLSLDIQGGNQVHDIALVP